MILEQGLTIIDLRRKFSACPFASAQGRAVRLSQRHWRCPASIPHANWSLQLSLAKLTASYPATLETCLNHDLLDLIMSIIFFIIDIIKYEWIKYRYRVLKSGEISI